VRVRLIGGILLMALISASIGIIGNSNLRSMRQADLDLYHYDTEPQPDLAYISVTFQKIRVALRDFLASPTADERTKFLNQANDLGRDLDGAIERSGAKYLSHEERGLFDQFIQARGAYRSFETQILAAGNSGRPQDGWTILWSDGYGNVAKTVLGAIAGIEQMKVADARKASAANLALANLEIYVPKRPKFLPRCKRGSRGQSSDVRNQSLFAACSRRLVGVSTEKTRGLLHQNIAQRDVALVPQMAERIAFTKVFDGDDGFVHIEGLWVIG